jgi:uncharacterized repeat protein (TIGR04076 family)
MKDLRIRVAQVKGNCMVYKKGDIIHLNKGYSMDMEKTDAVCMHSLASILPYHLPLTFGVKPSQLGLAGKNGDDKKAYVQCLDPCEYTGGGTVVFEIEILDR